MQETTMDNQQQQQPQTNTHTHIHSAKPNLNNSQKQTRANTYNVSQESEQYNRAYALANKIRPSKVRSSLYSFQIKSNVSMTEKMCICFFFLVQRKISKKFHNRNRYT